MGMQRFKLLIVSSVVALALTAANLPAQTGGSPVTSCKVSAATPSVSNGKTMPLSCDTNGNLRAIVGGLSIGSVSVTGGGDASASNQTSQIALETIIATSAVAIATHGQAQRESLTRIATTIVNLTSLLDGLEGLITSGNALLAPIATSNVAIATGTDGMKAMTANIATSMVSLAANGVSLSPAIATSLVAIATSNHSMAAVHSAIATSVVKMAAAGVGTDTELPAAVLAGDNKSLPTAPFVNSVNYCYDGSSLLNLCRGAATGAGVTDSGTMRVTIASDSAVATSLVQLAANGVSISPAVATSLVAIATGTHRMQEVHPHIATSIVKLAGAGLSVDPAIATSLVAMVGFQDGLEGLITSGNTYLLPIATSTVQSAILEARIATSEVGIATGIHAMAAVHSAIATSVVKIAQAGASTDTELPAAVLAGDAKALPTAPFVNSVIYCYDGSASLNLCRGSATGAGAANAFTVRVIMANDSPVATSPVAIATGINRMQEVHPHIATSVVKLAAAGLSVDPAIATSTVQSAILDTRIATAAVETASRQAQVATSVVALADRFPDRQIACTNMAAIATTATNYRQVIPAGAGQIIYVCTELWTVTQAALISFGYGQGTNCNIAPVELTGEMSIAASSGASRGSGLGMLYQIPANNAFCVRIATASGGAAIGGSVGYVRR